MGFETRAHSPAYFLLSRYYEAIPMGFETAKTIENRGKFQKNYEAIPMGFETVDAENGSDTNDGIMKQSLWDLKPTGLPASLVFPQIMKQSLWDLKRIYRIFCLNLS